MAQHLESIGQDPGVLHELQEELDLLDSPPSLWSRMSGSVREFAARQWSNLAGELQESREAMTLIRKALRDRSSLSEEERIFVRSQLLDMLRMLPAGTVVFFNATLPIPATSLLTPALLKRLGLIPSRWQEAHLISHLQAEADRLRSVGLDAEADEVVQICSEIEAEGRCRQEMARDARLLPFWDKNGDGQWDSEERSAYQEALSRALGQLEDESDLRCWFLLDEGEVVGPLRRSQLPEVAVAGEILICRAGDRLWLSLSEVLMGAEG